MAKKGLRRKGHLFKQGQIWWYQFHHNGKRIRKSSKSTYKSTAEAMLDKALADIGEGKIPQFTFEKTTFQDLIESLKTDYHKRNQKRPRTQRLEGFFGHWKAMAITKTSVDNYISKRQVEGAANATINRELAALKRMFKLGIQAGDVDVNRVPYIEMLPEDNVKEGFFESFEFDLLQTHLPDYLLGLSTFGYLTGWREGEVAGLTWDRVNMYHRTIRLSPGSTKNKKGRNIKMEPRLLSLLQEQEMLKAEGCPYVFHREGNKIRDFRSVWNTACREAGLGYGYRITVKYVEKYEKDGMKPGPTFHDLRRTAVRNMTRAGIPRQVAMMVSGHKTEAVYNRYDIADDKDLELAADKLHEYRDKEETQIGIGPNEGAMSEAGSEVKMAQLSLGDAIKLLTGLLAAGFSKDSVVCLNVGAMKISRPVDKNR